MGGGGHASGGFEAVLASAEQTGWRGLFRNPKVIALAAFASLGGVLYGYNQGVFSSVQVMPEFHNRFASTVGRMHRASLSGSRTNSTVGRMHRASLSGSRTNMLMLSA
jgi:hypothetical protein